ncbi:hypothetical protein B0T16DRAFT_132422 [Cercophora newfieldiana]|uniref:Uncharacterized protein n=1 Tax=Cercophora newfieldiana TaxID=92897 RepID=A0AA40CU95_9PEZI|nr:hypothetical protein B0T16DRAFT_132422 [Cercophora newfieldiana]
MTIATACICIAASPNVRDVHSTRVPTQHSLSLSPSQTPKRRQPSGHGINIDGGGGVWLLWRCTCDARNITMMSLPSRPCDAWPAWRQLAEIGGWFLLSSPLVITARVLFPLLCCRTTGNESMGMRHFRAHLLWQAAIQYTCYPSANVFGGTDLTLWGDRQRAYSTWKEGCGGWGLMRNGKGNAQQAKLWPTERRMGIRPQCHPCCPPPPALEPLK